MIECVACGRLVDEPGVCEACRAVNPPRFYEHGRPGHRRLSPSSSVGSVAKFGPAVHDRIWVLSQRGLSARSIAVAVGCSERMVYRVRRARQASLRRDVA